MSNFLESKVVRTILWILGGLIVLVVVFGLGVSVGYDRAGFASGFDKNYSRVFFGAPPGGAMGLVAPPMPVAIHGVVGKVIDLGTSTISVENQQGNEQSVIISSDTDIRDGDADSVIANIVVDDQVAVIGEPNNEGQIDAHFVRILSTPSSTTY